MPADEERIGQGDLNLIDERSEFVESLERLRAGRGPVAVDVERASGFRYSDRAYLVQIFRRGSGTLLLDPIALGPLDAVQDVIADDEWVLHAATQDLPSLRDAGLHPKRIFDTELAARLLGMPKVGLGAVAQELLGVELAKAHSADDWSTRPLPDSWLAYAALDVELLIDIRDELERRLREAGKLSWAREEFEDELRRPLGVKRENPWRKLTSTRARHPNAENVAQELWTSRDELARELDLAPGRLVPDRSLSAVVQRIPRSKGELASMSEFQGKASRTEIDRWWEAIQRGVRAEPAPKVRAPRDRVPPHRSWSRNHPEAHARLVAARDAVAALADDLRMPTENLLTPEFIRTLAWQPPEEISAARVSAALEDAGARPWQRELTSSVIADALLNAQVAEADAQDSTSEAGEPASRTGSTAVDGSGPRPN